MFAKRYAHDHSEPREIWKGMLLLSHVVVYVPSNLVNDGSKGKAFTVLRPSPVTCCPHPNILLVMSQSDYRTRMSTGDDGGDSPLPKLHEHCPTQDAVQPTVQAVMLN